jgi:hypothetical protein
MKKKLFKIGGLFLLAMILLLFAASFFLQSKAGTIIKNNINNAIDGEFGFQEADLSLLSSFPYAEIEITDAHLINHAPFEGDTLFKAKSIILKMAIGELLKNEQEPISLNKLLVEEAHLNMLINADGRTNYDIGKDKEEPAPSNTESTGSTLDLAFYSIANSQIEYNDLSNGIQLHLTALDHEGSGDLSLDKTELTTTTSSKISLEIDSTSYLKNHSIDLKALIGIDLLANTYTFLENEALINELPLVFDGDLTLRDKEQEINVNFKTPSSDFKNFLALFPETYRRNIEGVQTTGNFEVNGRLYGIIDEEHIPKMEINVKSDNASFQYPELPKKVKNIAIDASVMNKSGIANDTYVDIRKATFMIDEDRFTMSSRMSNLLENMYVNALLEGSMNLENIGKAYPLPEGTDLRGRLSADIATKFDMDAIEKEAYEKTETTGQMSVANFVYNSEDLTHPVAINQVALSFNPERVVVNEMIGKTGSTDFNIAGTIDNFLGYVFKDEKVKGNFTLKSNTFAINDFMTKEVETSVDEGSDKSTTAAEQEEIKIPAFLDCTIKATANNVHYDNLRLKNVSGDISIKDEVATLSNMSAAMLDGKLNFSGAVSTKEKDPTFNMQVGMDNFKIGETFQAMELFQILAPAANALEGKLNSKFNISGNLQDDFTLNFATLTGDVVAEVLAADINADRAKILTAIGNKLDFFKKENLDLKGLKTVLAFEDGRVIVKPFDFNYNDIKISVTGSHSFDHELNYSATMEVPAKYLGSEVNSLIAKIDEAELQDLTIPVVASIGGAYASPQVTTDMTSGVKELTSRLIQIQKEKLLAKGTDKAGELLGDILGKGQPKDSAGTTDSSAVQVQDILGNVLGSGTDKKDTLATQDSSNLTKDPVKDAARDILGGLLGRKKKDTATTKKDTLN